jgi:hypothetical protein
MILKGESKGRGEELREETADKFIAMVSARAETDLRLADFAPRSSLVVPAQDVRRAKYPAIDFHNHLDAQNPASACPTRFCAASTATTRCFCWAAEAGRKVTR